jgi:hypothetical protein
LRYDGPACPEVALRIEKALDNARKTAAKLSDGLTASGFDGVLNHAAAGEKLPVLTC